MNEQRKWFLEIESTPGEAAVKIVEMTTKDYVITKILLIKQRQGLRGLIPISREVLLWVECYQTSTHATETLFVKGRVSRCGKLHCCLILRNYHSHPTFSNHPLISQQPSTSWRDPPPAKRL